MQSSILPGAVEPRTGLLESAPREGAEVMSNTQTEEGAFDEVINQAVGEPRCKSAKKALTPSVVQEDSGEKEGAVESKMAGQGESKLKASLPEGLVCNVLLQLLVEPAAVVAKPKEAGSTAVIVPEEAGGTVVVAPVPNPVLTQEVKSSDAGSVDNTDKVAKPAELQKGYKTVQPQLQKDSAVKSELLGLVPSQEVASTKVEVPVQKAETKVDAPIGSSEFDSEEVQRVPTALNSPEKTASDIAVAGSVAAKGDLDAVVASKAKAEGVQGRVVFDGHAEPVPKEAKAHLATPRIVAKVISEESAPVKDGTGTAKSTETMQNTADIGPNMQSLPSKPAKSAGGTEFVEADDGKFPRSAKDDVQAISPKGEVVSAGTTLLVTEPMKQETSVTGAAAMEKVEGQIRTQAVEFKRIGADSMSVVLKPDAQTELHMQLRMEHGQVHVVVEFKRGDVQTLNGGWGQLQQTLAGQGIRVSELQNSSGTNFSQEDRSGNFQRQEWQQEQNGEKTLYRYFAEDEKAAGGRSLVLPAAKGVCLSLKADGKHSLEMWA
jgi:hypothetical protein